MCDFLDEKTVNEALEKDRANMDIEKANMKKEQELEKEE